MSVKGGTFLQTYPPVTRANQGPIPPPVDYKDRSSFKPKALRLVKIQNTIDGLRHMYHHHVAKRKTFQHVSERRRGHPVQVTASSSSCRSGISERKRSPEDSFQAEGNFSR